MRDWTAILIGYIEKMETMTESERVMIIDYVRYGIIIEELKEEIAQLKNQLKINKH